MDELLKKISAKYKIKTEDKTANAQILIKLLRDLIESLKSNRLFDALFTEVDPAGSYWNGLKVEHPDEYDLNFKFYFPRLCDLQVVSQCDGYLTVKVDCHQLKKQNKDQYDLLSTLLDENGYLSCDKVNRWFESIVQRAVLDIQNSWTSYKIKQQKNGPAKTLKIHNECGSHVFDVDLVPCFFIDSNRNINLWPDGFWTYKVELGYYLVPKPNKNLIPVLIHWRPSFQKQEEEIINKKDSAKQVVRLIKVIRNKHQEMHFLKSYFIKTVLLWILKDDPLTFDRKNLKNALILVLSHLENFVSTGKIPFFWQRGCNLIEKEKNITCANISSRLRVIIKYLEEDNLSKIKELFEFTDTVVQPIVSNAFYDTVPRPAPTNEFETESSDDEEYESTNSATNTLQSTDSTAALWIMGITAALTIGAEVISSIRQSNRNN